MLLRTGSGLVFRFWQRQLKDPPVMYWIDKAEWGVGLLTTKIQTFPIASLLRLCFSEPPILGDPNHLSLTIHGTSPPAEARRRRGAAGSSTSNSLHQAFVTLSSWMRFTRSSWYRFYDQTWATARKTVIWGAVAGIASKNISENLKWSTYKLLPTSSTEFLLRSSCPSGSSTARCCDAQLR